MAVKRYGRGGMGSEVFHVGWVVKKRVVFLWLTVAFGMVGLLGGDVVPGDAKERQEMAF